MKTFLIVALALVALTTATPQASALCVEINENWEPPAIDAHIDPNDPGSSYVRFDGNGPLATIHGGSC
ncbi:MAG TPA: hypothetical protein VNX21_03335 [Candidatus Thermoplasmatota archaeon]|nr:hypothetical protein [Candidatus Thermoplasmatota archaeon]